MARLPKNLTVTKEEVSQRFDLSEIAGVDLIDEPDLKAAIGQAIIDKMVNRSEKGKDLRGGTLAPYKKSYKESDQYEAFGKTRKVNMTLSGGMLSLIDILDSTGNEIKVGWDDPTENAKAFNHMTGDTVTKRQFFGIAQKEVAEILDDFSEDIERIKSDQNTPSAVSEFLTGLGRGAVAQTVSNNTNSSIVRTISLEDLFGEN